MYALTVHLPGTLAGYWQWLGMVLHHAGTVWCHGRAVGLHGSIRQAVWQLACAGSGR